MWASVVVADVGEYTAAKYKRTRSSKSCIRERTDRALASDAARGVAAEEDAPATSDYDGRPVAAERQ
jgi:hypothetical protein